MGLEATVDPQVFIEEQSEGYVRYQNPVTKKRWEVFGTCDKRGNCLVGATIDGEFIETLERAHELAIAYCGDDCPVTPAFKGCCPFTYNELDPLP